MSVMSITPEGEISCGYCRLICNPLVIMYNPINQIPPLNKLQHTAHTVYKHKFRTHIQYLQPAVRELSCTCILYVAEANTIKGHSSISLPVPGKLEDRRNADGREKEMNNFQAGIAINVGIMK